jgi:hypothetical protein
MCLEVLIVCKSIAGIETFMGVMVAAEASGFSCGKPSLLLLSACVEGHI